MIILNKAKG
ncbi:uncharacterized protein FFNC_01679 [Fusarium fujikuroi]|nr:uncharacterized protein FFNC_01679 [Fusarium fujikuroi]